VHKRAHARYSESPEYTVYTRYFLHRFYLKILAILNYGASGDEYMILGELIAALCFLAAFGYSLVAKKTRVAFTLITLGYLIIVVSVVGYQ
jgi:hypothetical protein